jgi:hypothetical protein
MVFRSKRVRYSARGRVRTADQILVGPLQGDLGLYGIIILKSKVIPLLN